MQGPESATGGVKEVEEAEEEEEEAEAPLYALFPSLLTSLDLVRIRFTYGKEFTRFRIFLFDNYNNMSANWVAIPLQHFEFGLQLPMDPFLADLLLLLQVQPAYVHPNTVRTIICFATLCRRLGVEPSKFLFSMFYYPVIMVENAISLWPR